MFNAAQYAGMELLGTGIGAIGSLMSGRSQQQAAGYSTSILEQRAGMTRDAAKLTEYKMRKNAKSIIGSQTADYAAAGVNPYSGSPIDVMVEDLANSELDIAIENYNSEVQARSFESEAAMTRYAGKQLNREARIGAGLSLLMGAAKYGQKLRRYK